MNHLRFATYDFRPGMWARFSFIFVFAFLAAPFHSLSAAGPESPAEKPERYLIVVETSASMKRCTENTRTAVNRLLYSGMSGELRPGDSIGLWTFNEEL